MFICIICIICAKLHIEQFRNITYFLERPKVKGPWGYYAGRSVRLFYNSAALAYTLGYVSLTFTSQTWSCALRGKLLIHYDYLLVTRPAYNGTYVPVWRRAFRHIYITCIFRFDYVLFNCKRALNSLSLFLSVSLTPWLSSILHYARSDFRGKPEVGETRNHLARERANLSSGVVPRCGRMAGCEIHSRLRINVVWNDSAPAAAASWMSLFHVRVFFLFFKQETHNTRSNKSAYLSRRSIFFYRFPEKRGDSV